MRKYLIGFAVGIAVSAASAATAAQIVGNSSYMMGWEVTVNGETVCTSPWAWVQTKQIDC